MHTFMYLASRQVFCFSSINLASRYGEGKPPARSVSTEAEAALVMGALHAPLLNPESHPYSHPHKDQKQCIT